MSDPLGLALLILVLPLAAAVLAFLFNGDFGSAKFEALSVPRFACGVAILGGLYMAGRFSVAWTAEVRAVCAAKARKLKRLAPFPRPWTNAEWWPRSIRRWSFV